MVATEEKTVCTELNAYCSWFATYKLSLNISKTNFIVFNNPKSYKHYNFNVKMNSYTLDCVNKITFLGVIIDCKLSWQEHIRHV